MSWFLVTLVLNVILYYWYTSILQKYNICGLSTWWEAFQEAGVDRLIKLFAQEEGVANILNYL